MADGKIWLDVPYAEKDEAKGQGARWDSAVRRWYAPRPGMAALDRWQPCQRYPIGYLARIGALALASLSTWCPAAAGSPTYAHASANVTGSAYGG
jgi:hypothetical protein